MVNNSGASTVNEENLPKSRHRLFRHFHIAATINPVAGNLFTSVAVYTCVKDNVYIYIQYFIVFSVKILPDHFVPYILSQITSDNNLSRHVMS